MFNSQVQTPETGAHRTVVPDVGVESGGLIACQWRGQHHVASSSRRVRPMVELYGRLNDRQLRVLRWVADGCPDGETAYASYKRTAASLQDRSCAKPSSTPARSMSTSTARK
jgi:hypothetical protein